MQSDTNPTSEDKIYAVPGERYVTRDTGVEYQLAFIASDFEDQKTKAVYVSLEPEQIFKHRLALVLLMFASRLLKGVVWIKQVDKFEQDFKEKTYTKKVN